MTSAALIGFFADHKDGDLKRFVFLDSTHMTPELKSAVQISLPLSSEVTGNISVPSHQKLVPHKRKT